MTMKLVDVRCDGIAPKGRRAGGPCQFLLLRIDPQTVGRIETKCQRCFLVREWIFSGESVWR